MSKAKRKRGSKTVTPAKYTGIILDAAEKQRRCILCGCSGHVGHQCDLDNLEKSTHLPAVTCPDCTRENSYNRETHEYVVCIKPCVMHSPDSLAPTPPPISEASSTLALHQSIQDLQGLADIF